MTVSQIHAAVVAAYREALAGSEFEDIKITPIDRETEDIVRGTAETEYEASYSRECGMRVMTVNEDLYYYAESAKNWKLECNRFQTLIEERLLYGIDEADVEITDIICETGGGALHISFSITRYDVIGYEDQQTKDAEEMETLTANYQIDTP